MKDYPADWPGDGPIDLAVHDLPHRSSTTEWWYMNSHLETTTGRKLSLFASFFRIVTGSDPQTREPQYAHSVIWAISDADSGRYYADSRIDPRSPEIIRKALRHDTDNGDKLLRRAMLEALDKDRIPRPDRVINDPIVVGDQQFWLDFGGNCFYKRDDDTYQLELFHDELKVGCNLNFRPLKRPVRHGNNGVVLGTSGEDMFYYLIPRCRVEGALILDGQPLVSEGSGWYDHEFGLSRFLDGDEGDETKKVKEDIAWNWLSAQLDNGWELTAYDLIDREGNGKGRWVITIDPAGNAQQYTEFTFTPLDSWMSTRTFCEYPIRWQLEIPAANIRLTAEAAFREQEFITVISAPAFWEGRVSVTGSMDGQEVSGCGYIERSGFDAVEKIEDFFGAVGRYTRQLIQTLLPLDPTHDQARRLIASAEHAHYLDGLDIEQYARAVIKPIREITDRGGKTWRSYALLACCDAVGGDSQKFAHLLVLPEMLHVGSLIVDDVQDKSPIRRGGPSCHVVHGEGLAINAGSSMYFLGQILLPETELSPAVQLRIYDMYFEALRATHAGQAIDIDGLHGMMPQVIESGNGALLEQRVLAIHRLKSAVPARSLAMMGALIGGGTQEQIKALGDFFERLGLAFQIIDDTLNLRGFENGLKSTGEDISQGKITMPVAKAMSRLPLAERRALWDTLSSKPTDPAIIAAVIEKLESCQALDSCVRQAHDLVEAGWQIVDPFLQDSHVKLTLRAFAWYVLERHY